MEDLKLLCIWLFVAWIVQFLIGMWFHWDIRGETAGPLLVLCYWGAKICGYTFAFTLAGSVLNET
jgi:FtsH-binding integral membrane protein